MNYKSTFFLLMVISTLLSCKKYLEVKTDKTLTVINTAADLQSLLDLYRYVNYSDPFINQVCSDDYYLTEARFKALTQQEQNLYIWANSNLYTPPSNAWSDTYDNIYRANLVMDNIDKVNFDSTSEIIKYDDLKGQALFLRAKSLFCAVSTWSLAYDSTSANKDLGVPLRLSSDFNQKTSRASVQETYDQIINDLLLAVALLPEKPLHVLRASKPAAQALLARVYISIGDYSKCRLYSDSCLKIKSAILDFNTLDTNSSVPFPAFNIEVIYESGAGFSTPLLPTRNRTDSNLVSTFSEHDLRKKILLKKNIDNSYSFKGGYSLAVGSLFDGIATDEVYLMRAECNARLGYDQLALDDIKALLSNRWLTNSYTSPSFGSSQEILNYILQERRKELILRGLRWMDIKRLNKRGANII